MQQPTEKPLKVYHTCLDFTNLVTSLAIEQCMYVSQHYLYILCCGEIVGYAVVSFDQSMLCKLHNLTSTKYTQSDISLQKTNFLF